MTSQRPSLKAKPTTLELEHPIEGKCGWILTVVGFDSKQVRTAIKEVAVKRASKQDAEVKMTVEGLTADSEANATIAAAAVIGWNEEFANSDESVGPYTPEKAFAIMADDEINWVREQVEACLRQRAKFF